MENQRLEARPPHPFLPFATGPLGQAHLRAHVQLQEGLVEEGQRELSAVLRRHGGGGPRHVHLHWHLALFELMLGSRDEACERFLKHILPHVAAGHALTDAPSLLWRLRLAGVDEVHLPWKPVAKVAAALVNAHPDPFVRVHQLIALAGAKQEGPLVSLAGDARPSNLRLARLARGLLLAGRGEWQRARHVVKPALATLASWGGSEAQQGLFATMWI